MPAVYTAPAVLKTSRDNLPDPPVLSFQCGRCDGERLFEGRWIHSVGDLQGVGLGDLALVRAQDPGVCRFLDYVCRNCTETRFYFALTTVQRILDANGKVEFVITKFGQSPAYRPHISKRVQRFLTGEDWDLYVKGRSAESHGLGVGAFAYYRRVIESQWSRLLDRLIAAADALKEQSVVTELQRVRGNWRFSNAVGELKVAIPDRLRVGSQNPFLLLHNAFSGGVHEYSDEECLQRACDGRVVLENLLAQIHEVLKDQEELGRAVARLARNVRADT